MLAELCNRCNRLVTAGTLLLLAVTAAAVEAAPEAPCVEAAYRAFDFWVGAWEVKAADGSVAGHNEISLDQQGCVLVERWHGAQGSTGMSLNFYEPLERQWRQVWVSPTFEIDIAGGMIEQSMVLEGTIVYLGDLTRHRFRGTWTPLPDGRVRQFFEQAGADGEWQPWFEGFYRRIDD